MGYTFSQNDVWDFAKFVNSETHQKGDELYFKFCPKCNGGGHDKDTFSINLSSGAFKCFRATCGYQGHFVELARDFNYPLNLGEPKVYKQLPQRNIQTRDPAIKYLESRGISKSITEKYHITSQKNNQNIIVFPFYDENNTLQFIKYRDSKFKKGNPGNKEWTEKDTKPILFGMAQCTDFEQLIVTEGQIDSLSIAECGVNNAVSVPTGAMGFTWYPFCADWITKFKEVIVFGDCEHGEVTLSEQLQARLTQKVKVVRICDYLGEKDANDILRKYGKQAIITAIEKSEVPKITNVKDLSEVRSVDLSKLPKISTNIPEIDKTTSGIAFGQLVLITGQRGKGKSTFMSQLVAESLQQEQNVFIYSGELADYHFKRWLDLQLAGEQNLIKYVNPYGENNYYTSSEVTDKISAWYKRKAFIYDNTYIPKNKNEMESLPDTIEKVIKQYGVSIVCVDNLMTAMDVITDNDNLYLAQGNFVNRLKTIAMKYGVIVFLVAHRRKVQNAVGKTLSLNDEVSGSSDITNRADIVMCYELNEDDQEPGGTLQITKNRIEGKLAYGKNHIDLHYQSSSKRIYGTNGPNTVYGWEKDFESVEDLL